MRKTFTQAIYDFQKTHSKFDYEKNENENETEINENIDNIDNNNISHKNRYNLVNRRYNFN